MAVRVQVDPDLAAVECKDCGAKLNPTAVLSRLAQEETRWSMRLEALREENKRLEAKVRCRCQHCGKMTGVRTY